MQEHIIWSNVDLSVDDWWDDWHEEVYPDASEEEKWEIITTENWASLDDERSNLDVELDNTILVIADLGFWWGRMNGFREILSGNIKDCLKPDCEYATWYLDEKGEFRGYAAHHDGCNHYRYRVWKSEATEDEQIELMDKLWDGKATEEEIETLTDSLGPTIAAVYGWEVGA